MRFWSKLKPFQQTLMVIAGIIMVAMAAFSTWLGINLQPLGNDNEPIITVEIRSGASIEEAAAILQEKGVIRSDLAYSVYSRITFSKLAAGTHSVSASMSVPEIINTLSSAGQNSYQLTILPEMSIKEIKDLLKKYDFTDYEVSTALSKKYDHPLLRDKPDEIDLEGYIFPDTYELGINNTVEDLLIMSFDNLYNKLSTDGSLTLMRSSDFNIHELLTLSSIVAKEAPKEDDQKIIAGVFQNRINAGMALGSDVTFQYAYKMGYCTANSPSCESVWNTRIHSGLPPGPIANMKYSTIQAVLKPTSSNYYYFVAGDDGIVYYASTDEGHQQNINNYCHELCQ